ncbi:cytidine deaminase family protein [Alkaliphilus transvaalensis]|uniref:cytidine deaminase family protein n=1 Tax=Alkaliphilus transvaalensis TaxID=114628 RepID=UPI00047C9524|nr:cytidine deaminase [Alkaliphilus transvaalensis]
MTFEELKEIAQKKVKPRKMSSDCYVASVASALITKNGNVYIGVCIDAPSSMGFCAEHSAIAQMVTNEESKICKIIAVDEYGKILPPCGRCREFIYQIDKDNLNTEVMVGEKKVVTIGELLPYQWN